MTEKKLSPEHYACATCKAPYKERHLFTCASFTGWVSGKKRIRVQRDAFWDFVVRKTAEVEQWPDWMKVSDWGQADE